MVLTPNSQHNYSCRAPRAHLQKLLQHGGWITFALQDTKSICHMTVEVMGSKAKIENNANHLT